jgi:hypothetical protein
MDADPFSKGAFLLPCQTNRRRSPLERDSQFNQTLLDFVLSAFIGVHRRFMKGSGLSTRKSLTQRAQLAERSWAAWEPGKTKSGGFD